MSGTFLEKYKILGKVGEGSFAEVLKCQDRKSGALYAAKRLKKQKESMTEVLKTPEVVAMRKLKQHPNVLHMIESHCDGIPGKVTMIFELMDMSLYDLIKSRKRCLPEVRVKNYLYQLLRGLDHLHTNGLFHRDIKPENILLKNEVIKLADLGSVRGIYSRPPYTEYVSTRWYRSPECLLTTGYYGPKMDVWASGCVFYEMITLKPLFPGSNEVDQVAKIHNILGSPSARILAKFRRHKSRNFDYYFPQQNGSGLGVLIPTLTHLGRNILKLMLIYDPDARPRVRRLLEHKYFHCFRDELSGHYSWNISATSSGSMDWRNPALLSYITSEHRKKSKHTTTKSKLSDKPKVPRLVVSSPIKQQVIITKPVGAKSYHASKTWETFPNIRKDSKGDIKLHLPKLPVPNNTPKNILPISTITVSPELPKQSVVLPKVSSNEKENKLKDFTQDKNSGNVHLPPIFSRNMESKFLTQNVTKSLPARRVLSTVEEVSSVCPSAKIPKKDLKKE